MSNWQKLQRKIATASPVNNGRISKQPPKLQKSKKQLELSLDEQLQAYRVQPSRDLAASLFSDDSEILITPSRLPAKWPSEKTKLGRYLALDCEFVGVGPKGAQSELARVSIVNYYGYVVLDTYVRPQRRVTDWRTRWSGVTPALVREAPSFQEVQKQVADLLEGKILVGHSIHNDMKVLMLSHSHSRTIDTQVLARFRDDPALKGRASLKRLLQYHLGLEIQTGSHDSVQDAQATMFLFRAFRLEFLKEKR